MAELRVNEKKTAATKIHSGSMNMYGSIEKRSAELFVARLAIVMCINAMVDDPDYSLFSYRLNNNLAEIVN